MLNLNYSYDRTFESCYIITLKNNYVSESMASRCMASCIANKMPAKYWQAFDGTNNKEIITPSHLEGKEHISWFKTMDHELSMSEIACALSHISLWAHCVTIDKPIIILEHDAIMTNSVSGHPLYNSILYLGNIEQQSKNWSVLLTPPHATHGNNYHFICRAHAYGIDPQIAKNMLAHVLRYGIHESLDLMLRADLFTIFQYGLNAYDASEIKNTTITNRKKTAGNTER